MTNLGIVFCHLVGLVVCSESDQIKLNQLVNYNSSNNQRLCIQNIDLALNVLKSSNIPIPDMISNMTAEELLNSEDLKYSLLETLKQTNELLYTSQNKNFAQDDDPYQGRQSIQSFQRPASLSSQGSRQYLHVQQDQSMAHSRRISDRQSNYSNMPLQQKAKPQQYQSFEIQGISPIDQKQSSPTKEFSDDPEQQYLDYQEQQLRQELKAINSSYQAIKGTVAVDSNFQDNSGNTSNRERSTQIKSTTHNSRDREKQKIQQKQSESKNYNKIVESTAKKMSQSKTVDAAFYDISANKKSKFSNITPYKDVDKTQRKGENIDISNLKNGADKSSLKTSFQYQTFQTNQVVKTEEDEIMQEMQTLKVQPEEKEKKNQKQEEINIPEVDGKTKIKILDWLIQEVKLIRAQTNSNKLLNDLPHYCKNGVFFCDLINRLNGKHYNLKGIDRNPKNLTAIVQNFSRILEYFRTFPKFNPRFLWAQNYFVDSQNSDIIWGFLDDIWHWNFNKISPTDPTNQIQQTKDKSPKQKNKSFKASQSIDRAQLPPKSNRSTIDNQTHNNTNMPFSTLSNISQIPRPNEYDTTTTPRNVRNTIGALSNRRPTEVQVNQTCETLTKERSYGNIHSGSHNMRTPNNRDSMLGNQRDAPLNQHQKSVYSTKLTNTRSASKSRRGDLTYSNTPIARDNRGNTYFFNDQTKSGQTHTLSVYTNTNKKVLNPYENFDINEEAEIEIKNWLFKIKFQHFFAREFSHQDIVNDPIRNGVFLAELFCFLERIDMYDIVLYPQTIAECKENLMKTLNLIRQRRRDIPDRFTQDSVVEKLLKRDKQSLYSILYIFMSSYQDATAAPKDVTISTIFETAGSNQYIPYSKEDQRMLESSLINWFKSMGIFHKLGKQNADIIESFIEIQQDVSNGSLLCEIVSTIFNVKLPGIFKDPRTETTCISNIRKGLEVLRKQRKMSQKFTWSEKELFEGKLQVAMGLFEDIHRCFDGLPPRKRGPNYFADGPYLGDTLYSVQPYLKYKQEKMMSSKKQAQSLSLEQAKSTEKSKFKMEQCISTGEKTFDLGGNGGITERRFEDVPSIYSNKNRDFISGNTNSTNEQLRQLMSVSSPKAPQVTLQVGNRPTFAQFLNKKLQSENENSRSPLKPQSIKVEQQNMPKIYIEPESKNNNKENQSHKFNVQGKKYDSFLTKNDISDKYPQPPQKSPISPISPRKSFEFDGKDKLRKPGQFSVEDYENEEHEANRSVFNGREKQKILEWLKLLKVKLPQHFDLDREEMSEFKDGVLLCQIIGILEMQKVENIQLQPKSKAACLQNIKKGLNVLKKKNQIPLYLIYCEEEIFKGNCEIIFQLLKSLRQVYKTKTKTLIENQKRETSRSTNRGTMKSNERSMGEFGTLNSDFKDPNDRKDGWPLSPKDRKKLNMPPMPKSIGLKHKFN